MIMSFSSLLMFSRALRIYVMSTAIDVACIVITSLWSISGPDTTFFITSTPMTWPEAQSFCRTHHTDLASVKNMTENQRVKSMVPARQKVWIGLFREPWKWLDGSNSSFRYWKETEPTNGDIPEQCVAADFSKLGKWEDWPCKERFAFVCYSPGEC